MGPAPRTRLGAGLLLLVCLVMIALVLWRAVTAKGDILLALSGVVIFSLVAYRSFKVVRA